LIFIAIKLLFNLDINEKHKNFLAYNF
jgi:hypothetical protein